MEKNGRLFLILFIIGSIFIGFFAVFIFTRNAFIDSMVLTNTGQIGDTIGGITAPIFGLIGFILVYLSFKEQFKANQIQIESLKQQQLDRVLTDEYNLIENLLSHLDNKIDLFEFVEKKDAKESSYLPKPLRKDEPIFYVSYRGATALNKFCLEITNHVGYYYDDLHFNLNLVEFLPDYFYIVIYSRNLKFKIANSKIDSSRRNILMDRFDLIYITKIKSNLSQIIKKYKALEIQNSILNELANAYNELERKNIGA